MTDISEILSPLNREYGFTLVFINDHEVELRLDGVMVARFNDANPETVNLEADRRRQVIEREMMA